MEWLVSCIRVVILYRTSSSVSASSVDEWRLFVAIHYTESGKTLSVVFYPLYEWFVLLQDHACSFRCRVLLCIRVLLHAIEFDGVLAS